MLAFHELAQERSELHLHIGGGRAAGFDEYYLALLNLVDKLKLHDRVTLHGAVSHTGQQLVRPIMTGNGRTASASASVFVATMPSNKASRPAGPCTRARRPSA